MNIDIDQFETEDRSMSDAEVEELRQQMINRVNIGKSRYAEQQTLALIAAYKQLQREHATLLASASPA